MPQALRPTRPILPPQLQAILDSLTLFPVGGATVPSAAATTKALRAARSARKVPVKKTAEETLNELDKALGIEAPPVTEAIKKGTRRIRTENPAVKAEVDEFAQAMKALPEAPTSPPPALPTAAPIAPPKLPEIPNVPNPRLAEIERALAETGDRARVPLSQLGVDAKGVRYGMAPWVNPQAAGMQAGEDIANALRAGRGAVGPVPRSPVPPNMQAFAAQRFAQAQAPAPLEQAIAGANPVDAFRRATAARLGKAAAGSAAVGAGLGAGVGGLNYLMGDGSQPPAQPTPQGAPQGQGPDLSMFSMPSYDNQLQRDILSTIGMQGTSGLPSPPSPMGGVPPGFQQTVARMRAAQQAQRQPQVPLPEVPETVEGPPEALRQQLLALGDPSRFNQLTANQASLQQLMPFSTNEQRPPQQRNALLRALLATGRGLGRMF